MKKYLIILILIILGSFVVVFIDDQIGWAKNICSKASFNEIIKEDRIFWAI